MVHQSQLFDPQGTTIRNRLLWGGRSLDLRALKEPQSQAERLKENREKTMQGVGSAVAALTKEILHVRGIGGMYEDEEELRKVFSAYGHVSHVTVRNRIDDDGLNTSWALVTMSNESDVQKVLAGASKLPLQLSVTLFDKKIAAASTGSMHKLVFFKCVPKTMEAVKKWPQSDAPNPTQKKLEYTGDWVGKWLPWTPARGYWLTIRELHDRRNLAFKARERPIVPAILKTNMTLARAPNMTDNLKRLYKIGLASFATELLRDFGVIDASYELMISHADLGNKRCMCTGSMDLVPWHFRPGDHEADKLRVDEFVSETLAGLNPKPARESDADHEAEPGRSLAELEAVAEVALAGDLRKELRFALKKDSEEKKKEAVLELLISQVREKRDGIDWEHFVKTDKRQHAGGNRRQEKKKIDSNQIEVKPQVVGVMNAADPAPHGLLHIVCKPYVPIDAFDNRCLRVLIEYKWQAFGRETFRQEAGIFLFRLLIWQFLSFMIANYGDNAVPKLVDRRPGPSYGSFELDTNRMMTLLGIVLAVLSPILGLGGGYVSTFLPLTPRSSQYLSTGKRVSRVSWYAFEGWFADLAADIPSPLTYATKQLISRRSASHAAAGLTRPTVTTTTSTTSGVNSQSHGELGTSIDKALWCLVVLPCYYIVALAAHFGLLVAACFLFSFAMFEMSDNTISLQDSLSTWWLGTRCSHSLEAGVPCTGVSSEGERATALLSLGAVTIAFSLALNCRALKVEILQMYHAASVSEHFGANSDPFHFSIVAMICQERLVMTMEKLQQGECGGLCAQVRCGISWICVRWF